MNIYIYRHAQTDGNIKKQYIGSTDQPLCWQGILSAQQAQKQFAAKTVYASPMQRCIQTAKIICPNAQIIKCAGLAEMNFGSFEGKSYDDLKDNADYIDWINSGCEAACPNGESKPSFISRTCAEFERILSLAKNNGEDKIFIVAHGGTIMSVLSSYAIPQKDYFDWQAKNCEGYLLHTDEILWRQKKLIVVKKLSAERSE